MTSAKTRSFLGLLLLSTSVLFFAGCGRASGGSTTTPAPDWTWQPPTPAATATSVSFNPLQRPISLTPISKDETAQLQELPNGLYLGDVHTGDILRIDVQNAGHWNNAVWLSPDRLLAGTASGALVLDLAKGVATTLYPDTTESYSIASPDGALAARQEGNRFSVWSTTEVRELLQLEGSFGAWSPQSDRFWYQSGDGYYVAAVDQPDGGVRRGKGGAWTADGTALVYADDTGIRSTDVSDGTDRLLYAWPQGQQVRRDALTLSFDGKYALIEAGHTWLVVSLESGKATEITATEEVNWSPVEDVLIVDIDWCKAEQKLALVDPDGTIREVLPVQASTAHWSPDGTMIAFNGAGVYRLDGSGQTDIPLFLETRNWSPDSARIAYIPSLPEHQCADIAGNTQILPFP